MNPTSLCSENSLCIARYGNVSTTINIANGTHSSKAVLISMYRYVPSVLIELLSVLLLLDLTDVSFTLDDEQKLIFWFPTGLSCTIFGTGESENALVSLLLCCCNLAATGGGADWLTLESADWLTLDLSPPL